MRRLKPSAVIFLLFLVFVCGLIFWAVGIQSGGINSVFNRVSESLKPRERVEISIIYAPELDTFMPQAIADFNGAYDEGINPLTGEKLQPNDKHITVTGKSGSSGTVMQGIVNAFQNVKSDNVAQPTIFAPSVSHWLRLANYQANSELFNLNEIVPTANAPVVMAIWESRLKAIQQKEGKTDIGWAELLKVFNNPKGWNDYGISGRKAVYYGHTDPYISSTALSTLIQEFTASARATTGKPVEIINYDQANDKNVQAGVRQIEELIKHYSSRTTEFKEYIAQGPNYVDFVALEENDLIFINQGKTEYKPPEKLVALYPKEGTFMHEHPFATVNASWVSDQQKEAAKIFTQYVISPKVQQKVLENGFRPVNKEVKLGYPFVSDLGVDPNQPSKVLQAPEPKTIVAIQQSWAFVKKRAELNILLDSSGSMQGDKIESAQKAIQLFVDKLPVENTAGLSSFSSVVRQDVAPESLETNAPKLKTGVTEIDASGTTALYDALSQSIKDLSKSKSTVIRAIVLLSDGQDTSSRISLNDLINQINENQNSDNPILIIPIAYGSDADINALNAIARASSTRVISGDTSDIEKILAIVSSYF